VRRSVGKGPEAGGCGRQWRWRAAWAHACSDRGEWGRTDGPLLQPERRGPLLCGPWPQCRGLNFLNRSILFKFEIQTLQTLTNPNSTFPSTKMLGKICL
jgi:hypothetical protein